MNKKDIAEIRKLFKKDGGAFDRLCGCYVDGEKKIRMSFAGSFVGLSEEECDKYYDIFRKALSGSLGKTLHQLDYTTEQEMEGELYRELYDLQISGLKDEEQLNAFYDKVITHYAYGEDYYIVLLHGIYDVPGKGSDLLDIEDASEEVYDFILCCICPVELSEAGLCYNAQENRVEERMRNLWVKLPMTAFLFPAFSDRGSDVHSLLYYTRKAEELHEEFIEGVVGGPAPLSFKTQQETFRELVEETVGQVCAYETARQINDNLAEMLEEHEDASEPLVLDKTDVRHLLENSGVDEERIRDFDQIYRETAGEETTFLAANLVDTKNTQVKMPDVQIKVNSLRTDLLQVQLVEGRRCLVIPLEGDIELNGMPVSAAEANVKA